MKKLNEEKGITLVALIITIIILLILAVVALREITGDGIIAKAKEARTRYETEQGEENTILSDYEDEIEQAISGGNQVTGKAYKQNASTTWIVTSDNRVIGVGDRKVLLECTYRDITNLSELGYTFENPNNIEYNQILLLNLNGEERVIFVVTTNRLYFGEFSFGNNVACNGHEGDSAVPDEGFEVKDYL